MKLRFSQAGWEETRLLTLEADKGGELAAARQLLQEGVQVLTAMINPLLVHRLREPLEQSGTLFINMEGGANLFAPKEESPLMYRNSLGYWQSNRAMGSWAARNVGRRAAVVSSFYETGYDSSYAFPQGFESGGGTVVYTGVTHSPMGSDDLGDTLKALAGARPDCVFVSSCGRDAAEFFSAWHASGLQGKIPLLASAFAAQTAVRAGTGGTAGTMLSCIPWAPSVNNPENRAFCHQFTAACGSAPNLFALLGYDTGSMIAGAVAAAAGGVRRKEELARALDNLRIASPRGTVAFAERSGIADGPLYVCEVRTALAGPQSRVIDTIPSLLAVERESSPSSLVAKSGWFDGYLCI